MDSLDLKICCQISYRYMNYGSYVGRHISPREIADKLGVSERTVRLRIRGMEKSGFIKYYQAVPNLKLFGIGSMEMYNFEAIDVQSKREALQYVLGRAAVLTVSDYVGPFFTTTMTGASTSEIAGLVTKLSDELKLARSVKLNERNLVDAGLLPNRLDWQILKRLRYDALCPGKEIANSLSISYRMVEYRISKMLASRVFFLKGMIDFQQPGIVFYALYLQVDPASQIDVLKKFNQMHSESLWSVIKPRDGAIVGMLASETPGGAEEALVKTLGIEGVKQCQLRILKEWLEPRRPNWIDELVEEKIATQKSVIAS